MTPKTTKPRDSLLATSRRLAVRLRPYWLGAIWLVAGSAAILLSATGIAGADVPAAEVAAEPSIPAGAPPLLRRLTESQYRASIADIFGPDIPVVGRFEHGLRVDGLLAVGTSQAGLSAFSFEQYDASAQAIAAEVVSDRHRAKLVPCQPQNEAQFDSACARQFIGHYGLMLFRRPLTQEETARYVRTARESQAKLGNFYQGLQYALAGMMDAPDFLVRVEHAVPDPKHRGQMMLDPYSQATRISYFLTNSTPDAELLRAAGAGELGTDSGLARQVDRLIASPDYVRGVRAYFEDMLRFDTFDELAKDPLIYPAFNSVVAHDAQEQTLNTITDLLIAQHGDYRDLFTTRDTFLTRRLGIVYQLPVATRNGWEHQEFPQGTDRAGILTNISFLALYSHPGRSSSTLRGKAIREMFLCQHVPDPPNNVDFSVVQDSSNAAMPTARIRLEAHRTSPACAGCHRLMDPLGLTLENFDGVGSFRAKENGAVIDASGQLDGHNFDGGPGLGQALHDSPRTAQCLVNQMYRSAVGRELAATEQPYIEFLDHAFEADHYRVADLMRRIALSHAFYSVTAAGAEGIPPSPARRTAAVRLSHGDRS